MFSLKATRESKACLICLSLRAEPESTPRLSPKMHDAIQVCVRSVSLQVYIMFRYLHYCGMRTNISMLVLSAYSSVLAYGILEEGQFGVKCLAQGHFISSQLVICENTKH